MSDAKSQQKAKFIPVNGTNKKCLVVVSALSDLSRASINKKILYEADRQTDGQMDRKTDKQTNRWTEIQTDR